jgi:hypothetical protein
VISIVIKVYLTDPAAGDDCKARRKGDEYKARGGGI